MRKQCRRKKRLSGYLLLPEQVAKYVTPMHMGLELLPLGLFTKAHADHLAMVINLVASDAASRGNGVWKIADQAGTVLTRMFERVKDGRSWNVTSEERESLKDAMVKIDRYLRTWTSSRLMTAAGTVDEINRKAKAEGRGFLERVELP